LSSRCAWQRAIGRPRDAGWSAHTGAHPPGLAWLWFINLLQFHGRHRRAGGQRDDRGCARLSGAADVCGLADPFWRLALVIAASAAGYLFWNWHPARVFMGDAGSIPLGFLVGWLMLDLALRGQWAQA
jgi:UDP-N-acetylmuramyl pentapeptide phosphotransferase/UDP-N-acetylglucosamine-1-phosphate transferase